MTRPLSLRIDLHAPAPRPLAASRTPALLGSARRLHDAADRAAALHTWTALAQTLPVPFFHTPAWMAGWLAAWPAGTPLWLLQAHHEGRCVGLGLVARGPARRLGPLPFVPAWHLQASGTALDGVCAEHNDFLVDPAAGPQVRATLIAQWQSLGRGARELHLSNATPAAAQALQQVAAQATPRLTLQQHAKPTFSVDLQRVREAGHDLLALRSANLRAQVRRALRAYASLGDLQLDAAPDTATALAWFGQLAHLHQLHWHSRGKPGAFALPGFVEFHHRLIADCGVDPAQTTHVQLLRLSAGPHVVAYLYNLVHAGQVSFYQSGLDYAVGGKQARPGYAAHTLAVEYNARLGHAVYDFLMGESRYKRDLATDEATMPTLVVQTRGGRLAAERALRRWRAARRAASASTAASQDDA